MMMQRGMRIMYNLRPHRALRFFTSSSSCPVDKKQRDQRKLENKIIMQNNNMLNYNMYSKQLNQNKETPTISSIGQRFIQHLLPKDYKTSVPRSYIDYSKVYAVGALASSAAMVLSTQSLL